MAKKVGKEENKWNWSIPRPPGHLKVGLILSNVAKAFGHKEIIYANRDLRRTYKDLNKRTNSLANYLLKKYGKGSFIASLTGMTIEGIEIYFASAKAGIVDIPLSYRLSSREIENILSHAKAKTLIYESRFENIVNNIKLNIDKIIIDEDKGGIGYENIVSSDDNEEPGIDINDDTPLTLGFTSGTTGMPKTYLRTHYENLLNHLQYAINFDMTYWDVTLTAVPPLTGFSWVCGSMITGATTVIMDFDPQKMLEAIQKYKVTIVYGVPTMYYMILNYPDFNRYDLSSLRAVASVGSPLPEFLLKDIWNKMTSNVYDHLGLQETGFVAVARPEMKRKKPSSVGAPTPLVEVKIVDNKGKEVPIGEVGEIIIKYPDGVGEYWINKEKSKESFKEGWFYTGDLGKFDKDGYLYVVGRKKDMIITGGYNVFAPEIEEIILSHPKVMDCAVVGIPHEKWGEMVIAVVKLKPGERSSEDEIISYCKERLAHYKVPKRVFFGNIPRTPSGKIMKFLLVKKYSEIIRRTR